jgi:hypothetical protein
LKIGVGRQGERLFHLLLERRANRKDVQVSRRPAAGDGEHAEATALPGAEGGGGNKSHLVSSDDEQKNAREIPEPVGPHCVFGHNIDRSVWMKHRRIRMFLVPRLCPGTEYAEKLLINSSEAVSTGIHVLRQAQHERIILNISESPSAHPELVEGRTEGFSTASEALCLR